MSFVFERLDQHKEYRAYADDQGLVCDVRLPPPGLSDSILVLSSPSLAYTIHIRHAGWTVNRARNQFLIYNRANNYYAGDGLEEYWYFYYQGQLFIVEIDITSADKPKDRPEHHYYYDILSLNLCSSVDGSKTRQKLNLKQIMFDKDDFLTSFTEAYTINNNYTIDYAIKHPEKPVIRCYEFYQTFSFRFNLTH